MLLNAQIDTSKSLNKWFQTPLGLAVAQEFVTELDLVKEHLRGDTLLQLGHCGENPWLEGLRYTHRWIASPYALPSSANHVECTLNQLPLARDSLDCVIVPMALELFGSSATLIDEIDRVLKPMGYVIFFSINPWSLWGGALKTGMLRCYEGSSVSMRTPFHLNRILLQRGYRQSSLNTFCYIPPVNNETFIKKTTFLDEVGKMLWPFPAGFYCYVAQKYEMIHPGLISKPIEQTVPQEYKSPLQPALAERLTPE